MKTKQADIHDMTTIGDLDQGTVFAVSIRDCPHRPAMKADRVTSGDPVPSNRDGMRGVVYLDTGMLVDLHHTTVVALVDYDELVWSLR